MKKILKFSDIKKKKEEENEAVESAIQAHRNIEKQIRSQGKDNVIDSGEGFIISPLSIGRDAWLERNGYRKKKKGQGKRGWWDV